MNAGEKDLAGSTLFGKLTIPPNISMSRTIAEANGLPLWWLFKSRVSTGNPGVWVIEAHHNGVPVTADTTFWTPLPPPGGQCFLSDPDPQESPDPDPQESPEVEPVPDGSLTPEEIRALGELADALSNRIVRRLIQELDKREHRK